VSRHLEPVPDLPPIEWVRRDPAEDRRRFRPLTLIGEVASEPPGWWVCPDCGRRRDRAGEPRTVTSVLCTGPATPYTRRHRPTEMRVQR
jgi:hypothetical protein